jgi:hypothetical protein
VGRSRSARSECTAYLKRGRFEVIVERSDAQSSVTVSNNLPVFCPFTFFTDREDKEGKNDVHCVYLRYSFLHGYSHTTGRGASFDSLPAALRRWLSVHDKFYHKLQEPSPFRLLSLADQS